MQQSSHLLEFLAQKELITDVVNQQTASRVLAEEEDMWKTSF